MRAIELATKRVVTVAANAPIGTAAKLMREKHVGDVVVIEKRGGMKVPVGIVTDRDLVVGVLAQDITDFTGIKVADVIADDLVTANAHDDILDIVHAMMTHRIRRVPIVDGNGELVGIVTYDDIAHLLSSELSALTSISALQTDDERSART